LEQVYAAQKPSIVGVANFDAEADAQIFRNSLKPKHTDEKAIIKILTTRTNHQIQEIRKTYAKLYNGKDLTQQIKEDTSGNFEKVALTLLLLRPEFEAKCLYEAMKGLGTNEDILIEIICTRNAEHLEQIVKAYDRLYDKSLEKVVKSETNGDFEKLLTSCLSCKRDKNGKIDENQALKDAETLYSAGEKKWGTDEKTFINILTLRSFTHIAAVAHQYEKVSKKTLVSAIQSEMSGDLEKGLVTIVNFARDPAAYWAERLKASMKGLGTDDHKLIRIMVTRAEIDMSSIRDTFGDRYGNGKTLVDWIKSDTSGNYEHILVSLALGNEQK